MRQIRIAALLLVGLALLPACKKRRSGAADAPSARPDPGAMASLSALPTDPGLARVKDALSRRVRPSLRVVPGKTATRGLPIGASRIGGHPDVPTGFAWPRRNGQPLTFLAQIHLAPLRPLVRQGVKARPGATLRYLPTTGRLYFFYDANNQPWGFKPGDRGGWQVIHLTDATSALRRTPPPTGTKKLPAYKPVPVTFRLEPTLPADDAPALADLTLTVAEKTSYTNVLERLHQRHEKAGATRLLGHPEIIQSSMELECQLVSNGVTLGNAKGWQDPRVKRLRRGAAEWRLLFQLDSVDAAGMMWGDVGRLYFWIREADLKARRFDRVWLILQCT